MADQSAQPNLTGQPPRADRQTSEDLAREADAASSGMIIGPGLPTPMPTNQQPRMAGQSAQPTQQDMMDMMREMHAYMQHQQAHAAAQEARLQAQAAAQEARIQELQTALENATINMNDLQQQPSQADPNAALMAQFMSLLQSNTNQDPLEKEENRITRLSTQHWRDHGPRLIGRENFALWQRAILIDAEYIGGREILDNEIDTPPEGDPIEKTRWEVRSRLLHTRILDMLPMNIQQQVQMDHLQSPVELWRRLGNIYGLSQAEERLVNVKTLINLHPQGNHMAMMRQWQELTSLMKEKKYTADEIYHDIGITLLGDWQKTFVRGELDTFFATSKEKDIHQLDIDKLIDQLEVRSPSTAGIYTPLSYPIYRQDQRTVPRGGGTREKTTSSQSRFPCPHCKRGYHKEEDCWVKYPEKQPVIDQEDSQDDSQENSSSRGGDD